MTKISFRKIHDSLASKISQHTDIQTLASQKELNTRVVFCTEGPDMTVELRRQLGRLNHKLINTLHDLGEFEVQTEVESPLKSFSGESIPLLVLISSNAKTIVPYGDKITAIVSNRLRASDAKKTTFVGFQRQLAPHESLVDDGLLPEDTFSLGRLRHDTAIVEPLLRDTEVLHIYLDCIRSGDVDEADALPTGLFAEELCQIARYAGESPKLKLIEVIGTRDSGTNAMLVAELLWYLSEGKAHQITDQPGSDPSAFSTYVVDIHGTEHSLNFYRHLSSNKWWVKDMAGEHLIACSQLEYENAIRGNLANRLLKLL